MGCDIDARMVEIAKANAQAAGVAGDITFKQCGYRTCALTRLMALSFQSTIWGTFV